MLAFVKRQANKFPAAKRAYHWARWKWHVFRDNWGALVWTRTRETVTPLGFKLHAGLHPAYEQMRNGTFEPEETALLAQLLQRVDRFIDVGANLGYYTCLALQNGRGVMAIEPQPRNLRSLYQNLISNGWERNAEVMPVALAASPGLLTLYGASGPSASLLKNWAGYSSRHSQTVAVATLDNLLAGRFDNERLLVKIDVEGAELGVLQGAQVTLRRGVRPMWLLEVCLHEFHPDGFNPDFLQVFQTFWDNGYEAYTAEATPRRVPRERVEAWWAARRTDSGTFNYIFATPDAVAGLTAP
ncbi:FkbM family methyltransferase [Lysobacter solisilvae (ex Woo and Kim 2022)]|uniref:FkbM family methyltransferase n=1 Tax=Agrilutibacter terrestris TaxID=2865112 RepID=A0A7H0FZ61_9GAMM|nr:FkbM family methyltransferase [Lysobacter terrestris]QNP41327.1 FkbM family methyltransferase [Lysobacter terrestris]